MRAVGTLFESVTSVESLAERRFFGDYELIEEAGRGGSSVVFKARQFGLNRIVALKLLSSGPAASRDFIHRFHTEAAAAAQLEHPNIVPVHEFGEHEGTHFLAMRFFEGGTLHALIARSRPGPEQIARLLIIVAGAVEHAHRRGILHRDLKPGNILLDTQGTPYVSDFGLARILEQDSSLTLTSSILGTAGYLAPEVASTGAVAATTSSDIYGLGSILYELLTGKPPFQKPTLAATLRAIADENPVRPRELIPSTPLDLQTICLKCLEKNPAKRYPTAQALADDLERFLNNEPIAARATSGSARVIRWSQRNPALATSYALLLLLLVFLLVGSPIAAFRINQARKAEAAQRGRAEAATRVETELRRKAQVESYTSDMNLALQAWTEGNLRHAQDLLRAHIPAPGGRDLRGFEWRYLWQLCRDQSIHTVDLDESIWGLATTPAHRFVAAAGDKNVHLFEPLTGRELKRLPFPNPDASNSWLVMALAQSATNLLAAHRASGVLTVWDLSSGTIISSFPAFTNNVGALALSPDGKLLAAADRQEFYSTQLAVWDIAKPAEPRILWSDHVAEGIAALAFSPRSTNLVVAKTGTVERSLEIYEPWSGRILNRIKDASPGYIGTLAFSPDGNLLAYSGAEGRIRIWDFSRNSEKASLAAHSGIIDSLSFSPDGQRLLSRGEDRAIRQWDVSTSQLSGTWRETASEAMPTVFAPDGSTIISAAGHFLKFWSTVEQQPAAEMTLSSGFTWPTISPDGRWLAISGITGSECATIVDLRTHKQLLTLSYKGSIPQTPAFSPDGQIFALADLEKEGLIGLWETASWGQPNGAHEPFRYLTNGFESGSISFSPDGKVLAVAGLSFPPFAPKESSHATNRLAFWGARSWNRLDLLPNAGIGTSEFTAAVVARFSPDSRLLAVSYRDGWIRLWDVPSQRLIHAWKEHHSTEWGADLRFSRDSRWLASVALGGPSAILFDLADLDRPRIVPLTRDTPSRFMWLEFAPDNKTLLTGHYNGLINFWNLDTSRIALALRHSGGPGCFLAFSPDGNLLVSKDAQGVVKLWPAASRNEIPQTKESK